MGADVAQMAYDGRAEQEYLSECSRMEEVH